MEHYDHLKIEKKWQKEWEKKKVYKTLSAKDAKKKKKEPFYVLDMFPYPSGAGLHVGHPRGYIGSDVLARMKRMQGYNVLHPMGYDAFGLPAEQYAIEHKIHPRKAVEENIETFRGQLEKIGFSYDWSRAVNTTDPEYYKWTQWIFLKLYEHGLAYEGESEVNWCPKLGTVLANDEIVDGPNGEPVSERGGYPVEKKKMRQWFLKITAYADKLLEGLDDLQWPEHIKEIQRNWIGKEEKNGKVTYKMRDAIFARQRYWGEPIPLYRDKNGTLHEVTKLPLKLPNLKSYEPTGEAEGPLAGVPAWVKKGYETNTMPGWAGSSWYFLRYMDPKNKKDIASKEELEYWKQVSVYVGGAEHATGHLLYARFWHKFLHDIGIVPTTEPFPEMYNQGLIMASDGRKMSKRWGNVINPDEIVNVYGADTLRVYEMFMGPFDDTIAWSTESIIGSRRFIEKVARVAEKVKNKNAETSGENKKILHKTIAGVTADINDFKFNTAISKMMICMTEFERNDSVSISDFKLFLQLLAPFAPHVTEELWYELGEKPSIHLSDWPEYDQKLTEDEVVTIAIQINGKTRGTIEVAKGTPESEVAELAQKETQVAKYLTAEIKKTIFIPNRLINFVVPIAVD